MYQRIVLAFDGSVEGRAALAEGMALAALCDAKVHLLSVLELTGSAGFGEGIHPIDDFDDDQLGYLRKLVDEGLEQLRASDVHDPEGHVAFGDPVEHIAGLAKEIKADLVVVGHRHQGLLARWWQGSLSRALLDEVDCSILVAMN
ncbi:universal stress protein [Marinobacter sp. R17]|uniref:universal stress protein n=1 Tax=unclassified Marinobacter TaxID=83889 RepID=UPI000F4D015D|nr:universal stress protein [Marinobacter sp. R17]ROU02259.1 universal stress protein [Marinobacter sp. R17]